MATTKVLPSVQKVNAADVQVRWMIRRDMGDVLNIEAQSFEFPWNEEDFLCCLRQRNCIGMVADYEHCIRGFMIYELFQDRMHVMSFAVAQKFRRFGIGRHMMGKLVNKLSEQRRTSITLEVRETNLGAQLFFQKAGFRATSVLRDYYEDTCEDAYAMEYALPGTTMIERGRSHC
jgi:ribosomal-protein-alanine N-acetyltransferase